MIDWYRQRARQERAMAMRTSGREALCAHNELYRDLLRQCHAQADRPNGICESCDLRPTCWALAAISMRRAAMLDWSQCNPSPRPGSTIRKLKRRYSSGVIIMIRMIVAIATFFATLIRQTAAAGRTDLCRHRHRRDDHGPVL